jgi:hypothetical protein
MSNEFNFNEGAFYEALESWRTMPFDRERSHCCHFAASIIEAATGRQIELPHSVVDEPVYMELHGYKNLYHALSKIFGMGLAPLQAKIGYVVYRKPTPDFVGDEATVGVADRSCAWFLGPQGIVPVRFSRCASVFKTY